MISINFIFLAIYFICIYVDNLMVRLVPVGISFNAASAMETTASRLRPKVGLLVLRIDGGKRSVQHVMFSLDLLVNWTARRFDY
jgi:hypothetical protein